MKKLILSTLLGSLITLTAISQKKPFLSDIYSYLENTSVFELNQEEGHVPLVPYSTNDQALTGIFSKSPYYLSLNGPWKFRYTDTPGKWQTVSSARNSTTPDGTPFVSHRTGR